MTQTQTASEAKKTLPKGWRWVRLGEVCNINPRRTDISFSNNELTSFVPMEAVNAEKGIISDVRQRPFSEVKKGYTYFEDGDVLFAKITPCMQNGKHAIAKNLLHNFGFASTEFHVIRPSSETISEWIHFFVRQPSVLHDATNHFTGAVGQQRVPDNFLKFLDFPLPPVGGQQRIIGLLHNEINAVEKARAAAQARLEAIKAMPAAFLRQIFPKHGQSLPNGWRWIKLGAICEGTGQYGTSKKSNGEGKGIPVLGMYQIHEGRIRWANISHVELEGNELSKYLLNRGDVLFNRTNSAELVGKTAVYDLNTEAAFASYLIRFRLLPMKADPYFVSMYINSQEGRKFIEKKMARAIGQVNISASVMREMPIPIPDISLQQKMAGLLKEQFTETEKIRASAEEELQIINALPAALLRRAFSGEI